MWKVASYVAQGRSHQFHQLPCQDRVYHIHQNNTEVIALADGAGSASHSQWGAESVTRTICMLLGEHFEEYISQEESIQVKKKILEQLLIALQKTAEEQQCELSQLASTLLAVAVQGDQFLAVHIGDGVIGYVKEGLAKILSYPENGEFANMTYFVTGSAALNFIKIYKGSRSKVNYFVLMSDGTEASLYDCRSKRLVDSVVDMAGWNSSFTRQDMQDTLDYNMQEVFLKQTGDDCSIIMMSWVESYMKLNQKEKWECFHLAGFYRDKKHRKIRKKLDAIMQICAERPSSLKEISQKTYIKIKYLRKYVRHLVDCDLLKEKEYNRFMVQG